MFQHSHTAFTYALFIINIFNIICSSWEIAQNIQKHSKPSLQRRFPFPNQPSQAPLLPQTDPTEWGQGLVAHGYININQASATSRGRLWLWVRSPSSISKETAEVSVTKLAREYRGSREKLHLVGNISGRGADEPPLICASHIRARLWTSDGEQRDVRK